VHDIEALDKGGSAGFHGFRFVPRPSAHPPAGAWGCRRSPASS
jgi:hypothetical protein